MKISLFYYSGAGNTKFIAKKLVAQLENKNKYAYRMSSNFRILIFLLLSFFSTVSFAQNKKDTLKVLFVGNSYTHVNNLPQIVSMVSQNVNTTLITKQSTIGGAKLREHWLGERGLKTKEIIKNGNFDIVVFEGYSMSTILEPDSLKKYLELFCNYTRKNGAEPYFYLTWARENNPQSQEIIDSVYYSIAAETNATVVPAGRAWKLARELRPDIKLYEKDGSHPSKFGTILTAYTFVATLTHEMPEKPKRAYSSKDIDGEFLLLMYFYKDEISDVAFFKKVVKSLVK